MGRALVLGGTQFFGIELVHNLVKEGWSVTIATRGQVKHPFGDLVRHIILDREDASTLVDNLSGRSWDVVFDQTCQAPQEALDACALFDGMVGHYVFTSTMAVYQHGVNLSEDAFDPIEYPIRILPTRSDYMGVAGYQEAKRASEAVFSRHASFPVTMVRFPLVIGANDYTRRLQFHVDRVIAGEQIGLPHPNIRLSFISSSVAACFLQWVAENQISGPINAAACGDISLNELCSIIAEEAGKEAVIVRNATPVNLSPYAYNGSWSLDVRLATHMGFQFAPVVDLVRSLAQYFIEKNV